MVEDDEENEKQDETIEEIERKLDEKLKESKELRLRTLITNKMDSMASRPSELGRENAIYITDEHARNEIIDRIMQAHGKEIETCTDNKLKNFIFSAILQLRKDLEEEKPVGSARVELITEEMKKAKAEEEGVWEVLNKFEEEVKKELRLKRRITTIMSSMRSELGPEDVKFINNKHNEIIDRILRTHGTKIENYNDTKLRNIIVWTIIGLQEEAEKLEESEKGREKNEGPKALATFNEKIPTAPPKTKPFIQVTEESVRWVLTKYMRYLGKYAADQNKLTEYNIIISFINNNLNDIITDFLKKHNEWFMTADEIARGLEEIIYKKYEDYKKTKKEQPIVTPPPSIPPVPQEATASFNKIKTKHFTEHSLFNISGLHMKNTWIMATIIAVIGAVAMLMGFGWGGSAAILFAFYILLPSEHRVTSVRKELAAQVMEAARTACRGGDKTSAKDLLQNIGITDEFRDELIETWEKEKKKEEEEKRKRQQWGTRNY